MSEVTPQGGTPPAAGAAPVAGTPASMTTTVPYGQTPPAAGTPVDIKSLIPAEFKDRPYLADVDNVEKLFKKLDGAQTLLGKRPAGIPDAAAPKEQWEAFWKAAGKPEKAEEYEFEKVEGLTYSDEFTGLVKGLFHGAHVPKDMAKNLQKGFDQIQLQMQKKHKDAEAASDAEFDKLVAPHMGADADKSLKQSQALIKSVLPADLAPHLDKLTAAQAAIMAVVINKFAEKYVTEDRLPMGGDGAGAQGENIESLRSQARALMALPEYNRVDHPENANTQAKVKAIYERINKISKRA